MAEERQRILSVQNHRVTSLRPPDQAAGFARGSACAARGAPPAGEDERLGLGLLGGALWPYGAKGVPTVEFFFVDQNRWG